MRPRSAPCAVVAALALAGCGGSGGGSTTTAAKPAVVRRDAQGCRLVTAPAARGEQRLPKPTARLDPAKTYAATVTTSCGPFTIRLAVKGAPKTAASFAFLARRRFYDGLAFHRVAAGFAEPTSPPQDGAPLHPVLIESIRVR
jgi:peptidyl-prolyl cis-trans isomerase B (cyclophilin B)